jgi:pyruvate formate lyase activating enzyme
MIRALIETSLIDWDGKLTTVLFVDKCNFMCPFCQNWELILHPERFPVFTWHDIEKKLVKKRGWIDGVVLTGGEPLFYYEEITEIASKIKALGLGVKLDTNGAYPEKLQKLLDRSLIDYVALDIKAPFDETYSIAAGTNINVESIKKTADILKNGNIDYEYRTTCVPKLINEESIKIIGESVKGAKLWVLQQYVPTNAYKKEYRELPRVTESQMNTLLMNARQYVTNVKWRGQTH